MKRNIARLTLVVISIATLYLSLAPVARADIVAPLPKRQATGVSPSLERSFYQPARFPPRL